ncbi:MAG: metallophosphoesterase [Clostridia bacterium]|nr:metallophosphoesterase [Clostridia bacterium]
MSKLLALFLALLTAFSALCGRALIVKAPADTGEFTPVLRFIAASDTHVETYLDIESHRMQKMLRLGYAIADADAEYNALDAVLVAGDLTDDGRKDQFNAFSAALNSCLREGTRFLGVTAKSHDGGTMRRKEVHEYYTAVTGNSPDFHTVINGFHFIGLSASDNDDVHYDDGQIAWLRAQLEEATAEDPDKPVFVTHHEHVRNTVYGSSDFEGWGETYFTDVLNDFPQVVDFSGHSHYPLNDPRSVWQGAFTAVGTGAIYYSEFTIDDVRTYHPDDSRRTSTCWIVEVDADNRVRLRGMDIPAQEFLCEYILDNPADPANRDYTPEKRAAASLPPVFEQGAALKVMKLAGDVKITAPAAKSDDSMEIVLYRAVAYDADGNEAAKTWTLPAYYTAGQQKTVTMKLSDLEKGSYEIRVVAETAYGVQSEPLTAALTVR